MDLTLDAGDFKLNIRAASVIIHNNKVLVHKNVNKDHYALIGGRVESGESSVDTVKREVFEELGKKINVLDYFATVENFFEMKDSKYHEILFIHKAEFEDEEDKKIEYSLKNIEGKDHLEYVWLDIDKLNSYNLLPLSAKSLLMSGKTPAHVINNDLR